MYESSSGFYFLQTRFYDPQVGRFINADGYVSTGSGLLSCNMYAYCYNNPVNYIDPMGNIPWLLILKIAVVTIAITVAAVIIYEVATSEKNDQVYNTETEAVEAWANKYRSQSKDREMGAILYKVTDSETGKVSYTYGRTYKGFKNNTIPGFMIGYLSGGISSIVDPNKEMIGFIHSHPNPNQGYHNDFPSKPDLFLLNLPGISEVYVVPYANCPGVPNIIEASKSNLWRH